MQTAYLGRKVAHLVHERAAIKLDYLLLDARRRGSHGP